MPLKLIRDDITGISCDAIVNAANSSLLGGGGVDGAIHRAAGPELLEECKTLGGCETGEAKITKGYGLPAKYVIHTVGPVWRGGGSGEEEYLRNCYRNSLAVAKERGFESIAFPLISSGAYGYPKEQALKVATEEISAFLSENDMLVYLVIFDKTSYIISEKLYSDITSFIDDRYEEEHRAYRSYAYEETKPGRRPGRAAAKKEAAEADGCLLSVGRTLDEELEDIDESFSEMLMRKIDEKGMTDAQCYKKANIDRKLFSKIRSNPLYRPSKTTAIAFAVALELPLAEAEDMLKKAGYALSRSNKFDIIIEYFITNGNYDIYEINKTLFSFDQPLLGV